ncbi:tetratricopeptide repeat protein [Vicingaceae bacterium]|nr:tetratricopeptide repeat protein [Vicingaceae bacterium]
MFNPIKILPSLLFFLLGLCSYASLYQLDSLKTSLSSKSDSIKVISYNKLANHYRIISEFDSAKSYVHNGLEISKKNNWDYGIALSYNSLTYINIYEFDLEAAMINGVAALNISEAKNDKENLGFAYLYIGYVNMVLKEYDEVLYYYNKSLALRKELGNNYNLGFSYTYIGNYYTGINKFDSAEHYHSLALATRIKTSDKRSIADSYLLLGSALFHQKKYDPAIRNYALALEKYEEINDKRRLAETYRNYSEVFIYKNELGLAEHYLMKSLEIADEIGAVDNLIPIYNELAFLQEKKGTFQEAYDYLRKYVAYKDSIETGTVYREVTKQILKHKRDKEEKIKQIQHEKEKETQQILTTAIACGLVLVVIFLLFVFNRLRITKKQKLVIEDQKKKVEHQKEEVEAAHQEIKDSITYAKRIQSAILPTDEIFKENLKESFILYKPKDIVAGDFYWMEQVNNKNEHTTLFAAADCTGHGVPGAMVSVVCNNALNRSVREYGITDPGNLLDKTREIVSEEFDKSHEDVKDGMDIALCSLEGNTLKYAGANNPLWIIRNGEIIETKANKQPIGQFDNPQPYKTHTFEVIKGDCIYIFSDGYVDQFGGEKGKKFKTKAFRELLLSANKLTMLEQKTFLIDVFNKWKGDLEQIDDVCIIGVRI